MSARSRNAHINAVAPLAEKWAVLPAKKFRDLASFIRVVPAMFEKASAKKQEEVGRLQAAFSAAERMRTDKAFLRGYKNGQRWVPMKMTAAQWKQADAGQLDYQDFVALREKQGIHMRA